MARSRYRSVRYDLDAGVELARIVAQAGGRAGADVVAAALGYSGTNNGTWLTRVANARLFGLVAGTGRHLELTERGRQVLDGTPPRAAAARRQAVLAVPLFGAVMDQARVDDGVLPDGETLAGVLEQRFGEPPAKAATVAAKLIASFAQAGLITSRPDGNYQLTGSATGFTPVDTRTLHSVAPWVALQRRHRGADARRTDRGPEVSDGLFLDEQADQEPERRSARRRIGAGAAVIVAAAVVAVPVGLVAASGGATHSTLSHHPPPSHLGRGPAERQVLTALSATTDSGNFNVDYHLSANPGTIPAATTTTTAACSYQTFVVPTNVPYPAALSGQPVPGVTIVAGGSASSGGGFVSGTGLGRGHVPNGSSKKLPPGSHRVRVRTCEGSAVAPSDTVVSGTGTIDTSPMAMVVSAQIGTPSAPANGLQVVVRVDGSSVYEDQGPATPSPVPPAGDANATGQAISGFAGITESTLGQREGAVAMMGMASPTGYLELDQQAITGADQVGTGAVDGVPVTVYRVSEDPSQLETAPGVSAEESKAITDAVRLLHENGYTQTTVDVSVDGSGFIRESKSTTGFSDGGSVVIDGTFSNFGCAGTVLMPGQQGTTGPASGCVSPDNGSAASTTTTTTTGPASATTVPTPAPSVRSPHAKKHPHASRTGTVVPTTAPPVPVTTVPPAGSGAGVPTPVPPPLGTGTSGTGGPPTG
ncbi:MAG TPA: hypothetical protein VKG43_09860 [Acidimicrobiales bacterium]|nr:hypothetical protein [Acidimicrobiales bacterium]